MFLQLLRLNPSFFVIEVQFTNAFFFLNTEKFFTTPGSKAKNSPDDWLISKFLNSSLYTDILILVFKDLFFFSKKGTCPLRCIIEQTISPTDGTTHVIYSVTREYEHIFPEHSNINFYYKDGTFQNVQNYKIILEGRIVSPQTILEIRLLCFSISPCEETKREARKIERKSNQIFRFFLILNFDPVLFYCFRDQGKESRHVFIWYLWKKVKVLCFCRK